MAGMLMLVCSRACALDESASTQSVPHAPIGQAGEVLPQEPGVTQQPTTDDESGGLFRAVRLELGPVRWRGSLGQDFRWQDSSVAARSRTRVDMFSLSAASYLWQPWFAQLRAGVGAVRSAAHSSASGPAGESPSSSDSASLTREAGLTLFPVSRFPFDTYANVSDSRTSGELTASDSSNRRFGLRQGYRTVDERTQFTARYEQSELTSAAYGRDTLDVLDAGVTRRQGEHLFELNGNRSRNHGGANGSDSELRRANGRHAYAPSSNVSIESLATVNYNTVTSVSASSVGASSTAVKQITSFATWRPEEGEPFYVAGQPLAITASARLFSTANESAGLADERRSANASLGANYAHSPNMRLAAGLTATRASAAGTDTQSSLQSVNAVYTPDSMKFGKLAYTWNLIGSGSNSVATGRVPRRTGNAQVSHNLVHAHEPGETARVSLSAGQSAGVSHDQVGNVPSLTHNAGVTWSATNGSGGLGYVSLSVTDARAFGPVPTAFQLVNLQANRHDSLTRLSHWSGNLTLQGTRQRPAPVESDFTWTTTGSLAYQHQRAFNVPRLRFTAVYSAQAQQLTSRAQGDIDAAREFTSQSAELRFDYMIGKLETRISARTAVIEDRRQSVLFLRWLRQI